MNYRACLWLMSWVKYGPNICFVEQVLNNTKFAVVGHVICCTVLSNVKETLTEKCTHSDQKACKESYSHYIKTYYYRNLRGT